MQVRSWPARMSGHAFACIGRIRRVQALLQASALAVRAASPSSILRPPVLRCIWLTRAKTCSGRHCATDELHLQLFTRIWNTQGLRAFKATMRATKPIAAPAQHPSTEWTVAIKVVAKDYIEIPPLTVVCAPLPD